MAFKFITTLMIMFSLNTAFSQEGEGGGVDVNGGGNEVEGVLQDLVEYENIEILPFKDLFEMASPHLAPYQHEIPFLEVLFKTVLAKKIWILQMNPSFSKNCINPSMIVGEVQVVACQNAKEVWISKEAWDRGNVDERRIRRSRLIAHEIFGALSLWAKIPYSYSRILTAKYLGTSSPLTQFSNTYSQLGYGNLPTMAELQKARALLIQMISNYVAVNGSVENFKQMEAYEILSSLTKLGIVNWQSENAQATFNYLGYGVRCELDRCGGISIIEAFENLWRESFVKKYNLL